MIPLKEALHKVSEAARFTGAESISLSDSLHRILAKDVYADVDLPPFNKSAMDGYACRRADLHRDLKVIGTLVAGQIAKQRIASGQSIKIMTGAMVPKGADCVVMKEQVQLQGRNIVRFVGSGTSDNICPAGEDMRKGDLVLAKGVRILPQHMALLAAASGSFLRVARRPKVGIFVTGNELVPPMHRPSPAQIRDSNSSQLTAQCAQMNVQAVNYGIVRDTRRAIDTAFSRAAGENDVVLITGGVSMGDTDYVPEILKRHRVKLLFEKVAIKPGKPTVFGVTSKVACFGLPGNPVSSFTVFELLVKPFLFRMMGHEHRSSLDRRPLRESFTRKRTNVEFWMPVRMRADGGVMPVEYHGSAHINALCSAQGLACIPGGAAKLEKGILVDVRPI